MPGNSHAGKLRFAVGVFAHNEERNIGACLRALISQTSEASEIATIIVVSSASTDTTDAIVEQYVISTSSLVRLVRQDKRHGKSNAINVFLSEVFGKEGIDAIAIVSADILPEPDVLDHFAKKLKQDGIGMVGGRVVPTNRTNTIMGRVAHTLWNLHHKVAMISPKCGEMVALRNIAPNIPENSAVDEASLEAHVTTANLRLGYVPEAIIRNRGPETVRDFLKQRRRIHAGHYWLKQTSGHTVPTGNVYLLVRLMLQEMRPFAFTHNAGILAAAFLEGWARILGLYDARVLGRNPTVWDIAHSTKNPLKKENPTQTDHAISTDTPL